MERNYVIIESGVAKQVRETVLKAVSETDLAKSLVDENRRVDTGLLPSGTVSMRQLGSVTSLLMWRPAKTVTFGIGASLVEQMRALTLDDNPNQEPTPATIALPLPHQLFGIKIQGSSIVDIFAWFMLTTPTDPDAPVFGAPLPNQDERGKMCAGKVGVGLSGTPMYKLGNTAIGHFYASVFNSEMSISNLPHTWPKTTPIDRNVAGTLHNWSKVPDALAVPWVTRITLGNLVEEFR